LADALGGAYDSAGWDKALAAINKATYG
jgi:hypothetical protein